VLKDPGSSLKSWIQIWIRMKLMQIRNPAIL